MKRRKEWTLIWLLLRPDQGSSGENREIIKRHYTTANKKVHPLLCSSNARVCIFIPFPDLCYQPDILLACARERALYRKIYRVRQGESTSRFNGTLLASAAEYQQRERERKARKRKKCLSAAECVCVRVFTAFLPARNKKSHSRQHARTLRRLMIFKRLFLLYDSALAPATRTRHLLLCLHGRHATCCLCKFHVVLSKRDTMITDLFLLGALRR